MRQFVRFEDKGLLEHDWDRREGGFYQTDVHFSDGLVLKIHTAWQDPHLVPDIATLRLDNELLHLRANGFVLRNRNIEPIRVAAA